MRSSECDDDLMQITLNDAADGFSTYTEPLTVVHLRTVSLARRFPVREERSKGWRTRAIDDETEGDVNHTPFHRIGRDMTAYVTLPVVPFSFFGMVLSPSFGREIRLSTGTHPKR